MMYPANYRDQEVKTILTAVQGGECFFLRGLSGAGKTNLLLHLQSFAQTGTRMIMVDGNRWSRPDGEACLQAMAQAVNPETVQREVGLAQVQEILHQALVSTPICLMLDLSMVLSKNPAFWQDSCFDGNLRALRDANKYRLTYLFAVRHDIPSPLELAELFLGNALWLGPLSPSDAVWSVESFLERKKLIWPAHITAHLIRISGGYPGFLRACCMAYSDLHVMDEERLFEHAAVRTRWEEFWQDQPTAEEMRASRIAEIPLVQYFSKTNQAKNNFTMKESLLLAYLQAHQDELCPKDDLIRAVWPEDKVVSLGVRDDSLSQLVRRLREKVETDPSHPIHILTVQGRGYRYLQ